MPPQSHFTHPSPSNHTPATARFLRRLNTSLVSRVSICSAWIALCPRCSLGLLIFIFHALAQFPPPQESWSPRPAQLMKWPLLATFQPITLLISFIAFRYVFSFLISKKGGNCVCLVQYCTTSNYNAWYLFPE